MSAEPFDITRINRVVHASQVCRVIHLVPPQVVVCKASLCRRAAQQTFRDLKASAGEPVFVCFMVSAPSYTDAFSQALSTLEVASQASTRITRSEERRVGKECRSRWS